jgi:hypothetical protein
MSFVDEHAGSSYEEIALHDAGVGPRLETGWITVVFDRLFSAPQALAAIDLQRWKRLGATLSDTDDPCERPRLRPRLSRYRAAQADESGALSATIATQKRAYAHGRLACPGTSIGPGQPERSKPHQGENRVGSDAEGPGRSRPEPWPSTREARRQLPMGPARPHGPAAEASGQGTTDGVPSALVSL